MAYLLLFTEVMIIAVLGLAAMAVGSALRLATFNAFGGILLIGLSLMMIVYPIHAPVGEVKYDPVSNTTLGENTTVTITDNQTFIDTESVDNASVGNITVVDNFYTPLDDRLKEIMSLGLLLVGIKGISNVIVMRRE